VRSFGLESIAVQDDSPCCLSEPVKLSKMSTMIRSTHTHPRYIVWLKYFLFVSTIVLLLGLIYMDFVKYPYSNSVLSKVLGILFIILLWSNSMLISAYFFGQNITVTDRGLWVEFLWKDFFVSWDKIIEIKPAYGFWRNSRISKPICVVLTDALTPFHRQLGLIYGFSVKAAFIIYPTISEYQSLIETIQKHVKKK
jgi:hypothetical protein